MKLKIINESIYNIDRSKLLTLWYEDESGNKYIPNKYDTPYDIPTDKYPYQVSQFPTVLNTNYLKCYDGGSKEIAQGSQSWPEDLVIAMVNSTEEYSLSEAILIAAQCCERCLNSLLYKYELGGYSEGSEEWKECGTSCNFCEGLS